MPGTQNSQQTLDWLAGVGTNDRGDKVQLNHTASVLVKLAEILITTAEDNLTRQGHMASGKTAASMQVVNVQTNATKASLDIEILSTYKFINDGVKGTEGGRGKYQFKTPYANKKMATAILIWIRKRGLKGRTKYTPVKTNARGAVINDPKGTGNEAKDKRLNKLSKADNLKSFAYAVSTNIKKHGIDPSYFFSGKSYSAIEVTKKAQKKMYADAFKLDIIETLQKLN